MKIFKTSNYIFTVRHLSINLFSYILLILTYRASLVFCYQNCSDPLWEKIVLVIEKNFWNSRPRPRIFKNFEITRTIYSNSAHWRYSCRPWHFSYYTFLYQSVLYTLVMHMNAIISVFETLQNQILAEKGYKFSLIWFKSQFIP